VPLLALVVDDHPASVELARYLLEAGGLDVVCAQDGGEALALAAAHHPDVIVLDLDLPVLDGCRVRDRLAAAPTLAAVPVVAMSAYEIDEFCPDHGRSDFAGYVGKPVDAATFADQVCATIAEPGQG
jgi:two-component system cell cycle response regulator DivK